MPSEQSWQNPLAEQSALPLQCLLQFIEEAPIGTSDNGHYVNFAGRGRTGDTLRPITPHHSKQGMGYIMAVIRSRAGVETSLYDQALPG
jgi:hypothetical protein